MEKIFIRLVTQEDIVSFLIREKTFCDYSHVEFVLDDGTTIGAHSSGGVAIRPSNYAKFTKVAKFAVSVTPEQKAAILAFAHAQVGKGYDYGAIASDLLSKDLHSRGKWDCSELVVAAFAAGGAPLLRMSETIDRYTPRDILLSLQITPVQ